MVNAVVHALGFAQLPLEPLGFELRQPVAKSLDGTVAWWHGPLAYSAGCHRHWGPTGGANVRADLLATAPPLQYPGAALLRSFLRTHGTSGAGAAQRWWPAGLRSADRRHAPGPKRAGNTHH